MKRNKKRNNESIILPNGCRCSTPSIHPDNWNKPDASLKVEWYITFWFYDSENRRKQVTKRLGINKISQLQARQEVVQRVTASILDRLHSGYNPITDQTIAPVNPDYEIDPKTPMTKALQLALTKVEAEEKTVKDIGYYLDSVIKAAGALSMSAMPIQDIKRRHVVRILDHLAKTKKRWSGNQYNTYRKYLLILFKRLVEVEAIEANPIKDIELKKTGSKPRELLSEADRKKVDKHLRKKYFTFWRYLHIFFHSGARTSELFRLQAKDVDLKNQRYKVTIKKGGEPVEVWKTIKDIALPLWKDIMKDCKAEDYLFARGLRPAPVAIQPYQITKRWTRLVKEKEGFEHIKVGFYSLKHLNTTEIVDLLNEEDAARLNSHKGTAMVRKIYDTKQADRQHERLKKVGNKFA